MSEFPEIQGYEVPAGSDEVSEKDLATRERELLGEDVAAELAGTPTGVAGTSEFAESHSASEVEPETPSLQASVTPEPERKAPGAGPSVYVPQKVDPSTSEFLKDWKVKRDLELERRDKVSNDRRESTREKARKAIDDFYENYNSKKEKEVERGHSEAEEFAKKRDAEIGSGKGTTWDRIADIIDGLGKPAEGVTPADKKRFAELVRSLKGDANAPGAAGY